jgi:cell division protein FtsB
MEFKCIYHDEPVGECPPVKELERLRAENRELRERIREMREGQAPPLQEDPGADTEERALREAPLREDGEVQG